MTNEQHIHARNLDLYLRYLSEAIGRDAFPPGGTAAWKMLRPDALADALGAHYSALGIPTVRGYKHERVFLQTHAEEDWEPEAATPPEPAPGAASSGLGYAAVDPAIGTNNYKAYLKWVETETGRRLPPGTIASWTFMSAPAIRTALPDLYAAIGIAPGEAARLEAGFLGREVSDIPVVSNEPVATPVAEPVPPLSAPAPPLSRTDAGAVPVITTPPPAPPPSPVRGVPPPTRSRGLVRRTRRRLILAAVILPILAVAAWIGLRYQAWAALPTVYPLTDNVALRTQPYDKAGDAGRMDLFGRFVDKAGSGVQQSVNRLKLLSEEPENGFYRATKNPSFWAWLKGDEEAVYVHTRYATADRDLFEQHQRVLGPLRDDLNGLDKLTSAYRRLLVDAFTKSAELRGRSLAQPCRPSAAISSSAPVPVGTYRNKSTGEIYAVVFTNDGRCFTINGLEAEGSGTPTVRPVQTEWGAPLTGPGAFKRGSGGALRYVPCEEESGEELTGKPPYTVFKQPPAVLPSIDSLIDMITPPSVVDTAVGG